MDAARWERLQELFHRALGLAPAERAALLDVECAGDGDLRRAVEALLLDAEDAGGTLGRMVADAAKNVTGASGTDLLGTRLGPYRVVEHLGEGGMGEVFLAEQEEPVRRRVALKTIKLGMDTREVLRRFEAERRALALMSHPSIARVLDAGSTPDGRPYFVMDLVTGPSLMEYCDRRRLSIDRRLALFLDVIGAVQHAHLRGIVHRDLKPSNVLVEEHDGRPVPKIIDFGIAKAVGERALEQTMVTEHGHLLGTPAYMSPEQAGLGSEDIDARTDVYSLGVLLYELLAGVPPLDPRSLRESGYEEMRRRIREEDPPLPSQRVGTLQEIADDVTTARSTGVGALQRSLRGDLDWIALRALEKDRNRRYTTPSELAADIGRYFRNEAVQAGPPTARYRALKFVRRHRTSVVAASLIVLVLLIGVVGTTIGMWRASRAEQRARIAAETANATATFLEGLFKESYPGRARGNPPNAREILDRGAARLEKELEDQPLVRARLMGIIGDVYRDIGEYDEAYRLLREDIRLREGQPDPDSLALAAAYNRLGMLFRITGRRDSAETVYLQALGIRERMLDPNDLDLAASLNNLSTLYAVAGDFDRAIPLMRRVLRIRETKLAGDAPLLGATYSNLGTMLSQIDQLDSARVYYDKNLRVQEARPGPPGPGLARAIYNLAGLEFDLDRDDVARPLYERALEILDKVYGPDHVEVSSALLNLGHVAARQGDFAAAETALERAMAIRVKVFGANSPMVAKVERVQGELRRRERRYGEAERLLVKSLRTFERENGPEHFEVSTTLLRYADCLDDMGEPERERAALERALAIREAALPAGDSRIAEVRDKLAAMEMAGAGS